MADSAPGAAKVVESIEAADVLAEAAKAGVNASAAEVVAASDGALTDEACKDDSTP